MPASSSSSRVSRIVLSLAAFLAATAAAQDGAGAVDDVLKRAQERLLRGDRAAARVLLDGFEPTRPADAARRDLLRAAAEARSLRAAAFLDVAETSADAIVAGDALRAAVAALADEDGLLDDPLLPRDPAARATPDDVALLGRRDAPPRSVLLARARAALDRRALTPSESGATLGDAELRFARAATARVDAMRVRVGDVVPVPGPLREPTRVRWIRVREGVASDADVIEATWPDGKAEFDEVVPADATGLALRAPGPGDYVLEARSLDGARRARRRVVVSDLDVAALAYPEAVVASVRLADAPREGAEIRFVPDDPSASPGVAARTDARGLAVAPRPRGAAGRVVASFEDHRAVASVGAPADDDGSARFPAAPQAHVLTDRSLYAPNDVVTGRILLHAPGPRPTTGLAGAADLAFDGAPAAGRDVEVALFAESEREVAFRGTTDAHGVLPFTLRVPFGARRGFARLRVVVRRAAADEGPRERLVVFDDLAFRVDEPERPALVLACEAPTTWEVGAPDPTVVVRAALPSGAPAAGVVGEFFARAGSWDDRVRVVFDDDGRARVVLALSSLRPDVLLAEGAVSWRLALRGPDGVVVEESRGLGVIARRTSATAPSASTGLRLELEEATPEAGAPLRVHVRGRPGARALVALGREASFAADVVDLDAGGAAVVLLPTPPEAWPSARLVARRLGADGDDAASLDVAFAAPGGAPRLVFEDDGASFAPSAEVALRFVVRDAAGRPRPARLAVALADAAASEIAPDLSEDPDVALRPPVGFREAAFAEATGAPMNRALLGLLFVDGRVAEPTPISTTGRRGGGRFMTRSRDFGPRTLRSEARSDACFVADLPTDADGRAMWIVRLPEGAARWRVIACAVDAAGRGARVRGAVRTVRPLATTLMGPSFLRPDDAADVSAVVVAAESRAARVRLAVEGAATATAKEETLDLAGDVPKTTTHLRVVAAAATGVALVAATLDGGRAPSSAFEIPVVAAATHEVVVATRVRAGTTENFAVAPTDGEFAGPVALELLSGRTARREALADDFSPPGLADDPAEDLPALVAETAAAPGFPANDDAREAATTVFARLRTLRTPDGYAARPGGPTDYAGTPAVVALLVRLRAVGLDPEAAAVAPDARVGFPAAAAAALDAAGGDAASALRSPTFRDDADATPEDRRAVAAFFAAVPDEPTRAALVLETVIATLRDAPDHREARRAVASFVRRGLPAPPATLARAGLALVAAGEPSLARDAFVRSAPGAATAPYGPLPGDDLRATAADRLLLAAALDLPAEERARAVDVLMDALDDGVVGGARARGAATAVVALAGEAATEPRVPAATAVVAVAGSSHVVALGADARARALSEIPPDATSWSVRAPASADLVVVQRRRGGPPPPSLVVERVVRRVVDVGGAERTEDLPRDAAGALVATVGDVLDVVVRTAAPASAAGDVPVLVVPLPAGVTVVGPANGWDLGDSDAFGDAPPVRSLEPVELALRVRVAVAGAFAWPAARAALRERAGFRGASAAERLVVGAAPDVAPSSTVLRAFDAPRGDALFAERLAAVEAKLADDAAGSADAALDAFLRLPHDAVPRATAERVLPSLVRAGRWDKVDAAWAAAEFAAGRDDEGRRLSALVGDDADAPRRAAPIFDDGRLSAALDRARVVERYVADPASLGPVETEAAILRLLATSRPDLPATERLARLAALRDAPSRVAEFDDGRARRLRAYAAAVGAEAAAALASVRMRDGVLDRVPEAPSVEAAVAAALDAATTAATSDAAPPEATDALESLLGATLPTEERGGATAAEPVLVAAQERAADALAARLLAAKEAPTSLPRGLLTAGSADAARARARRLLPLLGMRLRSSDPASEDPRRDILRILEGTIGPDDPAFADCVDALARRGPAFGRDAFRALTPEAREAVPTPALLAAAEDDPEGFWMRLAATRPDGREALAAGLDRVAPDAADPRVVALAATEDPRPLAGRPLAVLLRLLPDVGADAGAAIRAELAHRAALDPAPLGNALADGVVPAVREALVVALGDAGFTDVPWRDADPAAAALRDELGARAGDAAAADRLRARLAATLVGGGRAGAAERARLLGHLTATLTPRDVVRFGAPPASPERAARVASWDDEALREILAAPRPPTVVGAEDPESIDAASDSEDQASIAAALALLAPGRVDAVRAEAAAWFVRTAPERNAAEQVAAFAALGAAQSDVAPALLADPPRPPSAGTPAEIAAARVRVVEALDPRPEILQAARPLVAATGDAAAARAFVRLVLTRTGRATRIALPGGAAVEATFADEAEKVAAAASVFESSGETGLLGVDPPVDAAWRAALADRGVLLREGSR